MNYNYKDIDKFYTNIILEYLQKGYTIYSSCMAGHQGEISKIVLTNSNNELIGDDDTLWLNKLEEVKKYTFYKVDERKNNYYTDNLEFFNECKNKHNSRMRLKYKMEENKEVELKSKQAFIIAYRYCKQTKGYKTVKPKDIISVLKLYNKCYVVKIKNKNDLIIRY